MAARKSSSASQRQTAKASLARPAAGLLSAAGKRWWGASAGLLGTLLVWSLLQPVDAVSVFQGTATAQNLAWLVLATLTTAGCIACGVRYQFTARSWWIISAALLWLLVATVLAGRENNPRVAWYGFWQVVSLAACYYSASALLPGPRSRRAALQILLVGCVALALQGLEQVLIGMPATRAEYLADPEAFLAQDPNLDLPAGSPMRKRFEDRLLYSSEPYATFALTNSLAVLLTGGLVILSGLAWSVLHNSTWPGSTWLNSMWLDAPRRYSSFRRQQSNFHVAHTQAQAPSTAAASSMQRWLPFAALALTILIVGGCWFLTRSRVAYLSVALIGLAWGLANANRLRQHRRLLVGMSMLAGGLLLAGFWWLWHNDRLVLSEAPKSLSYRLEYWMATLAMLRDHAWWGVGLGNFQSYYPLYKLPTASEIVADPHNWPLDLCVSLSLPVGLLLIGWLGGRLLAGLRESAASGTEKQSVAEVAKTFGDAPVAAETLGESRYGKPRNTAEESVLQYCPDGCETAAALDAWSQRCLLWGAAIGGTICLGLLSLLSGLEISVLAVAWPLAAGLIACLRPLMEGGSLLAQGKVSQESRQRGGMVGVVGAMGTQSKVLATSASLRRTVSAAVAAMLLCLMASGSWQASGLAVPLLICLVITNRRCVAAQTAAGSAVAGATRTDQIAHARQPVGLSKWRQAAIVVLPALGLLCFLMQSWRPTATSWALLQQAQRAHESRTQLALIQAATEADWLDTEPLRWRTQILSGQAMRAGSDRFAPLADELLSSLDAWLARDSTKYSNWEMAGKHALELAEQARKLGLAPQKWLEAAIGYYSHGVARYPSSVGLNAQLATVLAIAGRWPEAQRQWQLAEQLDEATPHADQKLASQQLWLPMLPEGAAAEFAEQQPRIMAEPMLDWLRRHHAD